MSGHGWVTPLPSGAVARCGGPGLCSECALELVQSLKRHEWAKQLSADELRATRVFTKFGEFTFGQIVSEWTRFREGHHNFAESSRKIIDALSKLSPQPTAPVDNPVNPPA